MSRQQYVAQPYFGHIKTREMCIFYTLNKDPQAVMITCTMYIRCSPLTDVSVPHAAQYILYARHLRVAIQERAAGG